ncbi:MAG: EAL domain-containing protein [Cyanobacteria bacterium J06554_3]
MPDLEMPDLEMPGRVLVVDDTPTNLFVLSKLLTRKGYIVDQADNGVDAISLAKNHRPTVILLDIMMPHMDGFEVCNALRICEETAHIPIIFLSALDAPFDKVQAFKQGAADYVTKPFQPEEVLARVRHQTRLQLVKKQQMVIHDELEHRVKERTQLLEMAHNQLLEVALKDRLTRLPNRLSFVKRLSKIMAQPRGATDRHFAVIFLDCDRFKRVNDSLGHRIGDQLLKGVARRLQQLQIAHANIDTVARFGGDEFALLAFNVQRPRDVVAIADAVLDSLAQPFLLADHELFINASLGLVWGDASYVVAEHMLRDADVAMYQAKDCPQSRYRWFESDMHSSAVRLLELETDMRLALERREFKLHYQPIVDLERMKIVGFEALVRWQHPTKGLIAPNEFIRFAEESGFISALGTQVLETACTRLASWERSGLIAPETFVSVNMAAEQLLQPDVLMQVERILTQTGVSPQRLHLELTERSIIGNHALVDNVLQAFQQKGIKLSIDDFGTGYSALSYLHTLPVGCLKVDRSFVKSITHEPSSLGIVPLIISMAETMKMQVIAEGIEDVTQLRQLQNLGCKYGQGYLFQKALPAERAVALLNRPFGAWISEDWPEPEQINTNWVEPVSA